MIETNTNKTLTDMKLTHTERSKILRKVPYLTLENMIEVSDRLGAEFKYSELTNNSYFGWIKLPNQKTRYEIVIRPNQVESQFNDRWSQNTGRKVTHQPTRDKILQTISDVINN